MAANMQRRWKALLLLSIISSTISLAQARQLKTNITAATEGALQGSEQKVLCALELQLVVCGMPANLLTEHEQAFQQQCCSGWDSQQSSVVTGNSTPAVLSTISSVTASNSSGSSSSNLAVTPLAAAADIAHTIVETIKHAVTEKAAAASGTQAADEITRALRPDLDPNGPLNRIMPNFYYGTCTRQQEVMIPSFPADNKSIQITKQRVPQRLSQAVIRQTKANAIDNLRNTNFAGYSSLTQGMSDKDSAQVQATYRSLRTIDRNSGFVHPGGIIGPGELALMKERLSEHAALQSLAKKAMLTGSGVPPKKLSSTYYLPMDTPLDYTGPFPMPVVTARWNGVSAQHSDECPKNFPANAPRWLCAHVALVEFDARQAYKQALAFWATGNSRYAQNALEIIDAWSTTNQQFGLAWENGPLEAGWSVASFARALELLRGRVNNWDNTYWKFKSWVDRLLMPMMERFQRTSQLAISRGQKNVVGNWHSTIAEAWMAYGVLTNDRSRYNRAVELYHTTVKDYLRWGRGQWVHVAPGWRAVGEASETLRDIYHTQFALGGMLQVAEMAWQQDEDLYSSNDYALAAALELHAKIILAGDNDESKLPVGFKLDKSMPPPPKGCRWRFDIEKQLWTAVRTSDGKWVSDLKDGVKYMVGIKFLPTGWELGYNHYVGRLGMRMPQTQALIKRYYVDWYDLHFGLGTISHANTAALLWRTGMKQQSMCTRERGSRSGSQEAAEAPFLSMYVI